jgi:hypothetical protein
MATLAAVDPADGTVEVDANRPVRANITDGSGITLSLVDVKVNGISHTQANGKLRAEQTKTVSGGSIVDELTDVWFETIGEWYDAELDEITVDVEYNSSSIGTADFTTRKIESFLRNADAIFRTWAIYPPQPASRGEIEYFVAQWYQDAAYTLEYVVYEIVRFINADIWYYVATPYRDMSEASGIVATPHVWNQEASGVVQGTLVQIQQASGIVQGDQIDRFVAAGIVGVEFIFRTASTGIVSIAELKRVPASGVVYGVNADNVLEIHVIDESTYDELVDQGFVFS